MDQIILAKDCVLENGGLRSGLNENVAVVGGTGSGKTFSTLLPTILHMENDSVIATFSKQGEADRVAAYLRSRGYRVEICDLVHPIRSTIGCDPMYYTRTGTDLYNLCLDIMSCNDANTLKDDPFWTDSAQNLLFALMESTRKSLRGKAGLADVLDMFDALDIQGVSGNDSITTTLDILFEGIMKQSPKSQAAVSWRDFRMLPYRTASCVRTALGAAIHSKFPEEIRRFLTKSENVNFRELANEKTALIIVTSSLNSATYEFANMIFGVAIRQLLKYADRCPDHHLPRQVHLMFDDFACGVKINDFSQYISIFRAAGLSALILLQSESQLSSLYSEYEARTILNNCSAYVYLPGSMDLMTCKSVAERCSIPESEVLYAPIGKAFVMQAGREPMITERYDTTNDPFYRGYCEKNTGLSEQPNGIRAVGR